jgi:hypothetical protein
MNILEEAFARGYEKRVEELTKQASRGDFVRPVLQEIFDTVPALSNRFHANAVIPSRTPLNQSRALEDLVGIGKLTSLDQLNNAHLQLPHFQQQALAKTVRDWRSPNTSRAREYIKNLPFDSDKLDLTRNVLHRSLGLDPNIH